MKLHRIFAHGSLVGAALLTASCTTLTGDKVAELPLPGDFSEMTNDEKGDITELGFADLRTMLEEGNITSEQLVTAYLQRIENVDRAGAKLNSVLVIMPDAREQARWRDQERATGTVRGPLHGIPVVVKDNIEVAGAPTTAGSLALAGNDTDRDAPLIERLREQGAIILAKTNLSEWANIRSGNSTSGWSAVGGLSKNPWRGDGESEWLRNTCGSSAGTGAAVAAGLAPLGIGTETDGSITCPSGVNGVVGMKPTVGLVSRSLIVPIAHSQDTAGPMTRCVAGSAAMLTAMAGTNIADPTTAEADARKTDYLAALDGASLSGLRIGVIDNAEDKAVLAAHLADATKDMESAGATIVPLPDGWGVDLEKLGEAELKVLLYELKADLGTYLSRLPGNVPVRSLADVIAFNKRTPAELEYFGQELFDEAQALGGLNEKAYQDALATSKRLSQAEGIDKLMTDNDLDLIVAITNGPAWLSTLGEGDAYEGPSASQLPAIAGYPHLTVPMAKVRGLPVGISFIAGKWQDATVLKAGVAFEALRGGCPLNGLPFGLANPG